MGENLAYTHGTQRDLRHLTHIVFVQNFISCKHIGAENNLLILNSLNQN
jgi:hypothetical protein